MMRVRHRIGAAVAVAVAATALAACGGSSSDEGGGEPATVQPIKGTDRNAVTLTAQAARRLGIQTALVRRLGAQTTVPYGAVVYNADGSTFTYTSPRPRVYVRAPIAVARIAGGEAVLAKGPAVGTVVVTVGSQELYGSEYEVEED
ncbi:MAG TPA: hypothetical protein VK510_21075 [Solirubrobacteraceae bacterium]|jgi:hypothetical protein|nr:hypothetical protein [Solirubrobacteraceae bacterium]